jgi:hypothetical protein
MLPSAVVVAQEKGFERQHPFEPWPLAAASRPPVEVMPSRSYLLKQWPTRPYQEDGAQLSSTALLASSSANDNDRAPSHDFPRRTAAVDLRIRPVRYQHPLRESVGRPPMPGEVRRRTGVPLTSTPRRGFESLPLRPPRPSAGPRSGVLPALTRRSAARSALESLPLSPQKIRCKRKWTTSQREEIRSS